MTGLLNPKIVGNTPFLFGVTLVVYLGHGIFIRVAVLLFSKSVFGRGLNLRKLRGSNRKEVVHLCRRSTRRPSTHSHEYDKNGDTCARSGLKETPLKHEA